MTQTATQNGKPTLTCTPAKRGFRVKCLACGEPAMRVYVDDVTLLQCGECEAEFSPEDIRERLAGWSALLAWVETAPANDD